MNETIVAQLREAQQAEALLRLQRDLGIALSSTSDLDRTLHEVLKTVLQIEGIDCGGVYLVDECRDLYLAAHQGISPQFAEIVARLQRASPRGQRVLAGLAVYRGFHDFDISQDEILQSEGLRAVAVLPVKNEGQVVAVLNLASRTRDEILPGARDAVEAIAAQIGGVVARVRMEAALRQSQRNLEALFDALDDLVFVIGLDGRIIHANFQVRMRLGYSLPEIVGQPVTDLHPPDRRQEAADIFARMLAGQTSVCPVPVLAKDGTLLEVETKISRGEWDGRPALFGISRDMSERIRTEHLLRTENAFREAVIDGVAEGLCVCRDISEFPHLRFTVWNHRMTEITGYTLEQINRSGWYETLYPDESRCEAIRADAAAFQEGREYRGAEWVITRADGEQRTLLVWTSRLDTGQPPNTCWPWSRTSRKRTACNRRSARARTSWPRCWPR